MCQTREDWVSVLAALRNKSSERCIDLSKAPQKIARGNLFSCKLCIVHPDTSRLLRPFLKLYLPSPSSPRYWRDSRKTLFFFFFTTPDIFIFATIFPHPEKKTRTGAGIFLGFVTSSLRVPMTSRL